MAKGGWSKEILKKLAEGKLESEALLELQRSAKEEDRYERLLEAEQERVSWPDKIVLCLQEHLYVVERNGQRVVKCSCGQEFGDYRQNWKLNALVFARDTEEKLEEIYRGPRKPDPQWCILREFYCPGCGTQLDVETVMPGYPFVFNFLPDFESYDRNQKG